MLEPGREVQYQEGDQEEVGTLIALDGAEALVFDGGDFVEVDREAIVGQRPSALDKLMEAEPDLTGQFLLEDVLTALPELVEGTAEEIEEFLADDEALKEFGGRGRMKVRRLQRFGKKHPGKVKGLVATAARRRGRRPQGGENSVFWNPRTMGNRRGRFRQPGFR